MKVISFTQEEKETLVEFFGDMIISLKKSMYEDRKRYISVMRMRMLRFGRKNENEY